MGCKFPVAAGIGVPSFDCQNAHTKIEKIICNDRSLSSLDLELSVRYRLIMSLAGDPHSIMDSQRAWIKERNFCKTIECLKDAYEKRSREIGLMGQALYGFDFVKTLIR
jgi:uncharacterized protein